MEQGRTRRENIGKKNKPRRGMPLFDVARGVTESNRAELSKARIRVVNFWKGSDSARVPLFFKIQARARVRLELIKIELGSGSFV